MNVFEKYIQLNYVVNDIGIELERLGNQNFYKALPVNLDTNVLLDINELKSEIEEIILFVDKALSGGSEKIVWYKINVVDQAINEYVGIGFLNPHNWLAFIIDYLSKDRAEQSGDTIVSLFNTSFTWAICFTLSQDDGYLEIARFMQNGTQQECL